MRIKKKLKINAVVSLLIAFLISIVLVFSFYNLDKANKSAKIAGDIITRSLERVLLRNDYLRSNRERAKEQSYDTNIQINNLLMLASEYFQSANEKKIIAQMIEAQESHNEIFFAIVANREKNCVNGKLTGFPLDMEDRLLNQLNISSYEKVIQYRALQASSRQARASALSLATGAVIAGLLVIIATAYVQFMVDGPVHHESCQSSVRRCNA
jgi:hypothetical protein